MTRALGQGLGTRAGLTAPANRSSANRQRPTPAAGTSADASALPFGDAAFDLVVAYNSLMDVEDLPGSVWEAERVLGPGGHLGFCVTHLFMDAGRFTSREADAAFVVSGSYLGFRRPFEGTEKPAGLEMSLRTFLRW